MTSPTFSNDPHNCVNLTRSGLPYESSCINSLMNPRCLAQCSLLYFRCPKYAFWMNIRFSWCVKWGRTRETIVIQGDEVTGKRIELGAVMSPLSWSFTAWVSLLLFQLQPKCLFSNKETGWFLSHLWLLTSFHASLTASSVKVLLFFKNSFLVWLFLGTDKHHQNV